MQSWHYHRNNYAQYKKKLRGNNSSSACTILFESESRRAEELCSERIFYEEGQLKNLFFFSHSFEGLLSDLHWNACLGDRTRDWRVTCICFSHTRGKWLCLLGTSFYSDPGLRWRARGKGSGSPGQPAEPTPHKYCRHRTVTPELWKRVRKRDRESRIKKTP